MPDTTDTLARPHSDADLRASNDSAVKAERTIRVVTVAQEPDLQESLIEADRAAYPRFLMHSTFADLWPAVYEEFPEYQFALLDSRQGTVLAHGNSVPFHWDGQVSSLPQSATALAGHARAGRCDGIPATALGALQAVVHVKYQRQGLSRRVLETMAMLAGQYHIADLFAPIRPSEKARYPLIDMEAYARWQRSDGLPLDPWVRTHCVLGAEPVGVPQAWAVVTGSRAQWEDWTGMSLPQTGSYVVPGGLVPVYVDVEADSGCYEEPHVWMHYRIHKTSPQTEGRVT